MSSNSVSGNQLQGAIDKALNFAIERGNMQMISMAMERGGNAATLLEAGMKRQAMEMIELALQKGADPHVLLFAAVLPAKQPDGRAVPDPQTGLEWVAAALAHGADANAHKPGNMEATWAPLHFAQNDFSGNLQTIELLLQHGAKVDEPSPIGTPLMRAVEAGDVAAVEYFIGKGADPTFLCEKQNSFPMQALEDSARFASQDKERLLMSMMQHIPTGGGPATPVQMSSEKDIAVLKPLELKTKTAPKPEPPRKSFSL